LTRGSNPSSPPPKALGNSPECHDEGNVAFSKPANGGGVVALVIRVAADKTAATDKGGDAPPDAPKGD
jgi:hypothetical protein